MKWFKTVLVMTVLALWVLAVNHCRLEKVPGLEFLTCCQHEDAEKTASHHDSDCEDDSCAAVEESLYKTESSQVVAVKPTLLLLASFLSVPLEDDVSAQTVHNLPASIPLELPNTWQFACRAALPPRAPSLHS